MAQGRVKVVSFENIPSKAGEILKKKKKVLKKVVKKPLYSDKNNQLLITEDYNLLRLQIIVRPFFIRKYKIETQLLELFLFLYSLNFFAQADYSKLPKSFHYKQIKRMVDLGHFVIVVEGKNIAQNVFTLSRKSKKVVEDYYKYLSGEKTFTKMEDVKNELKGIAKKNNDLVNALAESPLEPMTKYFR